MEKTIVRLLLIPAYSEAKGFRPTERISKPNVVFFINSQTTTSAINAKNKPAFTREPPNICVSQGNLREAFCPIKFEESKLERYVSGMMSCKAKVLK